MSVDVQVKVAELCQNMRKQAELKAEAEKLQAWFSAQAERDLADTKRKTISYYEPGNAKVTVGTAGTVKPVSNLMIREVFGRVADDFVKEELSYKLTAAGKDILRILYEGNYNEDISLTDIVKELSSDTAERKALMKKLRGVYAKDMQTLLALGITEREASDYAYLAEEAVNGEKIRYIMQAAGWKNLSEVRAKVNAAVIVDESIKVTAEIQ